MTATPAPTKKKITGRSLLAAGREHNRKVDLNYLRKVPASAADIPEGKVVVHSGVIPAPLNVNGFRAWTQFAADDCIEICPCEWAPRLGKHYRDRLAPDEARFDQITRAVKAAILDASPRGEDGAIAVDPPLEALMWTIAAIGVQSHAAAERPTAFAKEVAASIAAHVNRLNEHIIREPFGPGVKLARKTLPGQQERLQWGFPKQSSTD